MTQKTLLKFNSVFLFFTVLIYRKHGFPLMFSASFIIFRPQIV